MKMSRD